MDVLRNNYFKRLLSVVLALCMLATNMYVGVTYADDSTVETVQIGTADELYTFATRVNNGETTLNAILTADIVVNEGIMMEDSTDAKVCIPIGDSSNRYNGVFDGQ